MSPEAQVEYNRLMSKTVARERGFLPITSHDLVSLIEELQCETFCEAPAAVPLSIVREFFANAKEDKNGYTFVRGMTVDYNPPAIRKIIGQPAKRRGVEEWTYKTKDDVDLDEILARLCVPGTEWKLKVGISEPLKFSASAMNKYARAWNLFICANILPSTHAHEVTVERAILLWGILNGQYIDLGFLIHQNILKFLTGKVTATIPHASVAAALCMDVGVEWADDEPVQVQTAPIDDALIERMVEWSGGIPHGRGLGYVIQGAEGGGVPPRVPRVPRGSRASSSQGDVDRTGLADAQFRRLTRRIDAMHDINRRYAEDMTEALGVAFQATGIEVHWPVFGAHAQYPPPDSPPEEGDPADD